LEQWCSGCKEVDLLGRSPWIIYIMISAIRFIIYLLEFGPSPIIWYQILRFMARYYLTFPLDFILCSSPIVHQKPKEIHLFSIVLEPIYAFKISFLVSRS